LVPTSNKSRDYNFEGIESMKLDCSGIKGAPPTRMMQTANVLTTLQVDNFPVKKMKHFSSFFPNLLTNFHGEVDSDTVQNLSNVTGVVSIPNSNIKNGSLRNLHPELIGLNIGGCYYLGDSELSTLGCKNLKVLNVAYTCFSNAGIRRIPNVDKIEMFIFGQNSFVNDDIFESLRSLKTLYLYMDVTPFSDAKLDELRHAGVSVLELE
jgi:hypothetical protein